MANKKKLDTRFQERVAPALKVSSNKDTLYSIKPKKDVYYIEKAYEGYRLVKRQKGGSGTSDISERYTGTEMEIYLKGMEAGADITRKRK